MHLKLRKFLSGIDSKNIGKTSLITNSVFTQNLLPKNHSVLIKKDGYFNYQKTLAVKEKEATKLEHILLIKKDIAFRASTDKTQSPFVKKEQFILKNGNLYDNSTGKLVLIIKNVIAFDADQNNIYWVSKDNLLYKSDFSGKEKMKIFDSFYSPVKSIKISPDHSKILLSNDYEILFAYLNFPDSEKIFLNRFSEKIGECLWLNSDYVIFILADKIKISEVDNRNEINMVELPDIKPVKIYFNQQDKKLYVSTKDDILVSEQIIQ
ncbi:MAG: hypothetical protein AAB509_03215, partial [Patescibacteria group bacterium]